MKHSSIILKRLDIYNETGDKQARNYVLIVNRPGLPERDQV